MTNSRVVIPIAAAKTVTAEAFVPAVTANKRNASSQKSHSAKSGFIKSFKQIK